MDNMKLIESVRVRRSLWDPRDERYPLRDEHKIRWQEIAQEMGFPFLEVKTRWRSLRDTFKRELRKRVTGLEEGEHVKSKWPYFNLMSFLEETCNTRCPSHLSNREGYSEDSASEGSGFQPYEGKRKRSQEGKLWRKSMKRESPSPPAAEDGWFEEADQEIKADPLEILCRDGDDDYQFLLSLLPYLREIPKARKMVVRSKLQQVFIDEQCAGEHYTSNLHEFCHSTRTSEPAVGECSTSGYQISAADVVTTKLDEISDGLEDA